MSNPEHRPSEPEADRSLLPPEDTPSQGPSLVLMYSLIALALAVAIGFALMIVLPFHYRR